MQHKNVVLSCLCVIFACLVTEHENRFVSIPVDTMVIACIAQEYHNPTVFGLQPCVLV